MIYTASYFERQNWHGAPTSISLKDPQWFDGDRLPFLAPSSFLLAAWKRGITEQEYIDRYRDEIRERWGQVVTWLKQLDPVEDVTLLCWERSGEFCHRNLAIKLVRHYRPECFGGCDLPKSTAA